MHKYAKNGLSDSISIKSIDSKFTENAKLGSFNSIFQHIRSTNEGTTQSFKDESLAYPSLKIQKLSTDFATIPSNLISPCENIEKSSNSDPQDSNNQIVSVNKPHEFDEEVIAPKSLNPNMILHKNKKRDYKYFSKIE